MLILLPIYKTKCTSRRIRLISDDETQQVNVYITSIPTCDGSQTSSALVEFKGGKPGFLSHLEDYPLENWQIEIRDDDVNFDSHFFGFTQMYPTVLGQTIASDIIAITGLDGHAYGSWRGRGNLARMWLRDVLGKDLPNCRTMIYGYNSKVSSHGIDTIMDYGRGFLEGIKRIRHTQEFRGDYTSSFLVKVVQIDERDHATIAALHKATYGILFFGTPHQGLPMDNIQGMISDEHPRMALLGQVQAGSDLLIYQRPDFRNLIRDRKIISFYETQQTRGLQLNAKTCSWGRTGAYMTAVKTESALLGLPDSIETPIPVNADHSRIVKFDSRNEEAYKSALGYLK